MEYMEIPCGGRVGAEIPSRHHCPHGSSLYHHRCPILLVVPLRRHRCLVVVVSLVCESQWCWTGGQRPDLTNVLNEQKKAKKSMVWVYIGAAVLSSLSCRRAIIVAWSSLLSSSSWQRLHHAVLVVAETQEGGRGATDSWF